MFLSAMPHAFSLSTHQHPSRSFSWGDAARSRSSCRINGSSLAVAWKMTTGRWPTVLGKTFLRPISHLRSGLSRELFEETGLMVGRRGTLAGAVGPAWQAFAASGCVPIPAHLYPLARAITPPGRVRRFDTWFFLTGSTAILTDSALPDGELLDLGWFTLPDARDLDLPNITRLVLEDLAGLLTKARVSTDASEPLPYYYSDGTAFRRDLISCKVALPRLDMAKLVRMLRASRPSCLGS